MAEMVFDRENLLDEPCISCGCAKFDELFSEWYCNETVCLKQTKRADNAETRRAKNANNSH